MMDSSINIRSIQHYMYCPRRFGLLELNCDWAENVSVVKANIMHENVHDGSHNFSSKNKMVRSAVAIYCDNPEYDIFGISDCIEFEKYSKGSYIPELNDTFKVNIVEYKPKKPKDANYHESDAMQVFAQKICADYVWKCNSEAYIYYSDVRRRIKLPFDTDFDRYNSTLKSFLNSMRSILKSGAVPDKIKGQKCSGCSLEDCCFPKNIGYSVKDSVMKAGDVI